MEGLAGIDVPHTGLIHERGNGVQSWPQNEAGTEEITMQRVLLQQMSEPLPGMPLFPDDLRREKLYFEAQPANSDTCGMNALNNLCQRPQFKLSDLQEAEAEHARAHEGGRFAHTVPAKDLPTGFFDLEALKIAASKVGLEIVDVEPVTDYRKSACLAFSEAAASSQDATWFLGYIVYDGRPGHPLHYYTLRRDERFPGVWIRLDSQLASSSAPEDCRNRRITSDELWASYKANAHHFEAWVLRWYPVVYCKGAAQEVCRQLERDSSGVFKVSEARASEALKHCGWVVSSTVKHLVEDLPRATVRELLVRFARPSEAEMRRALEAANWDVAVAQPAIDQVLRERIRTVQGVGAGDSAPRRALSLCDWHPHEAARLLSLQLQCKVGNDRLGELHEALTLAGEEVDHAEALLALAPEVGNMIITKTLLEQTKTWSVETARQILQVQKRFSRVSVAVALEVLRRNDDDPRAACEMLADYQKGVQRVVLENADEDLLKNDELAIAEAALSTTDWEPNVSFSVAKQLTIAVQQTRKLLRSRGVTQFFPVDAVLAALAAAEQKPQAAARYLLGMPEERQPLTPAGGSRVQYGQRAPGGTTQSHRVGNPTGYPGMAPPQQAQERRSPSENEDDSCTVM